MTKDAAERLALERAAETGTAQAVWEHVGGTMPDGTPLVAQRRYVVTPAAQRPPRFVWRQLAVIPAPGQPQ